MRLLLIMSLLVLAGCNRDRRAEILEAEYSKAVLDDERCAIAAKIADAWLERNNQEKYQAWQFTRKINCNLAEARRAIMY